jgi:hypothetical protein
LFCVNRGNVGGGFGVGSDKASLLAMTYEIFEILYGTHGGGWELQECNNERKGREKKGRRRGKGRGRERGKEKDER